MPAGITRPLHLIRLGLQAIEVCKSATMVNASQIRIYGPCKIVYNVVGTDAYSVVESHLNE